MLRRTSASACGGERGICMRHVIGPQAIAYAAIALATTLTSAGLVAAEPRTSLKDLLAQPVRPVAYNRADWNPLVEQVAKEIRTPIVVDGQAGQLLGIVPGRSVPFDEPAQTAGELLTAVLKRIDPDNRLCFTASADDYGRVELLLTSRASAAKRGLLVVPDAVPVDPAGLRVSLAFEKNTLENGLLLLCHAIDAHLRLDDAGLAKAGLPLTRQFGVKIEGRPATAALDEMLKRFDPTGSTAYVFTQNTRRRMVVVVGSKERLTNHGPWPAVELFADIAERAPPQREQLWAFRNPQRWVGEALAAPIAGESRPATLAEALQFVAGKTKLPIEISAVDFRIAGISRDQEVMFDPRGREARAVIYDLLQQADPAKQATLVACIERREEDAFVLIVTTRKAANSSGRSLLSDYNLSPDDIPSGKD
jgi:hypothetical protein